MFELSPEGSGWTETVLYSFGYGEGGPNYGVIMDPAGNLYGITYGKKIYGLHGPGTIFELSKAGGNWTEQVIHEIDPSGFPSGLTMDAAGNIFGVSSSTVFELSPRRRGGWHMMVIHTFPSSPEDGAGPVGALVFDQGGNLYGATSGGGREYGGTVYELSPVTTGKTKGQWTEKILHSFKYNGSNGPNSKGGCVPLAGVVLDAARNIYGTTLEGGYGAIGGEGIVFELVALVGTDRYKEKILLSFYDQDGEFPQSGLIVDSSGNVYGVAAQGGTYGAGVVFEVTP